MHILECSLPFLCFLLTYRQNTLARWVVWGLCLKPDRNQDRGLRLLGNHHIRNISMILIHHHDFPHGTCSIKWQWSCHYQIKEHFTQHNLPDISEWLSTVKPCWTPWKEFNTLGLTIYPWQLSEPNQQIKQASKI